ncbi:signal-transducing adaptor protein 1-like isoform X1 [Carcharodon carcharias]|uniref:signal-transducing adaptor protein 1-like isoform X1 n=1 Tax=Carcharodon carcharias TaxID=13397 RepID=UPI001B7EEB17|nr:signal-transducing adaptor protein 1-like isoform X1 [Carcharodon carcharias]
MSSSKPTRHRCSAIPGYQEGYLEKLESKSQKYKRFWTVLRGNNLFFQVTSRDPMYIEKLNLDDLVSVESEDSLNKDLQVPNLILRLKHGDVKLKADSLESREQWKSFILTVAKLEIPNLALLPGQIHRLKEVLEEEIKERSKLTAPPLLARSRTPEPVEDNYDDVENLPSCYYKISRVEAEIMLERSMEYGNILMRPGSDNKSFAITTRQMFKGNALVKHYRVRCADNGYIIEVDSGVLCNSMQEIIDYFVQYTNGALKPLERSMDYEINLSFVQEDVESGELIHQKQQQTPTKTPTRKSLPPVKEEKPSPKIPIILEPEGKYLNDAEIEKLSQVKIETQPKKMPMLPPSKTLTQAHSSQFKVLPGLTSAVNSELRTKLMERKVAMNE